MSLNSQKLFKRKANSNIQRSETLHKKPEKCAGLPNSQISKTIEELISKEKRRTQVFNTNKKHSLTEKEASQPNNLTKNVSQKVLPKAIKFREKFTFHSP